MLTYGHALLSIATVGALWRSKGKTLRVLVVLIHLLAFDICFNRLTHIGRNIFTPVAAERNVVSEQVLALAHRADVFSRPYCFLVLNIVVDLAVLALWPMVGWRSTAGQRLELDRE